MRQTADAERAIVLGDRTVAYRLRRSRRRTIGFTVDREGLTVAAPERARLGEIERVLGEHAGWVLGKLDAWHERPQRPVLSGVEGDVVPLRGKPLTLRIDPGRQRGYRLDEAAAVLMLAGPAPAGTALLAALRAEARADFLARLTRLAELLGVPVPPLRLSSARTRWGSCNHRGHIALNWRLILLPPALIDYVVAHELAHLREMNHSPAFWAVVEQLCPDWRERRRTLKELGQQLPDIAIGEK